MSVEIPTEAIKQLQIALRKQANMSSYDPDDTPLPNLPSPEETTSEIDPSPPYLRCKHCRGRLLRGAAALICVFCGRETCKDLPPDPINFRNTFGYRWLLHSLSLNGSEVVDLPAEPKESNRGQVANKDGLTLTELLNLEIKWTSMLEDTGTGLSDEKLSQPWSFLDLAGVNLDNFFSEGEKDAALNGSVEAFESSKQIAIAERNAFQGHESLSLFENMQSSGKAVESAQEPFESSQQIAITESSVFRGHENLSLFENVQPSEVAVQSAQEPFEVSKQIPGAETNALQGHENLSLFENVQPYETAVQSTQGESGDSISSWPASFQSVAHSENLSQPSTSFDPFVGSTVDLSAHIDTVFGSVGISTNEPNHGITTPGSMTNDWFLDDLSSISNSELAGHPAQSESIHTVKEERISQNENMYSTGIDWAEGTQWQTSSNKVPDNKNADEVNDSFGAWDDFTSSSSAQIPFDNSSMQSVNQTTPTDQTSITNLFSTASNSEDLGFGTFLQPDLSAGTFSSLRNSTVDRTQPKASSLVRVADESSQGKDDVMVGGEGSMSEDVNKIMSQMHDLSFMLENNLSIPTKRDGVHSLSKDDT